MSSSSADHLTVFQFPWCVEDSRNNIGILLLFLKFTWVWEFVQILAGHFTCFANIFLISPNTRSDSAAKTADDVTFFLANLFGVLLNVTFKKLFFKTTKFSKIIYFLFFKLIIEEIKKTKIKNFKISLVMDIIGTEVIQWRG